ncbi:BadF/BadG/BcrA/BcrD ATPase family protein [Sinisalibacter aestuarii]|uniref:N-acetylglucosamine kinase n=1 Tax=Sinisalibacter aestuarii TaxID=2949426 RepID=A0ABQ5LQT3_9RHOB|nr:BadF/BadG/BcrA/BcrD ATPase family protein [Sinisalibacter aestuarii]GKY87372.1 N-acetylglucosamine kinase [Sinisalibacter aestuarii]
MDKTNATGLIMVIDGGGSTCRARLVAPDGTILGAATGGAANPTTDAVAARRTIVDTLRAAYADAGRDSALATGDLLYLALAGTPEREHFLAPLRDELPFARIVLSSDLAAGVQAALGDGDGVVVNVGTGSYFVSRRAGELWRIGGRGMIVSDECSGAWLGLNLLRDTVHAHDRLIEPSPLTDRVLEECGGDIDALVIFARHASPRDFAAFAPMLLTADNAGDPIARGLMARALGEMTRILDRHDATGLGRIVLIGGLADAYRARLPAPYRALCRDPLGDTLSGAIELARREAGAVAR